MLAQKKPFYNIFGSVIRPVISDEKDRLLAIASMQELATFVPQIDVSKNVDILPIAFDACVINRGNKNGDLVNTATALATYKTFIHKFIDSEHNRQKIIGVILTACLTEFGTNRPLQESDVIGTNKPFNVTLGGVLWKAVNEDLCDLVEEAGDPTSPYYMKVSASWELGFTDYHIIMMPDQRERNLEAGTLISDPAEIKKLEPYLKCFKGSGVYQGKAIYRMPNENVVAMGVGLTEKPAADVEGVAVDLTPETPESAEVLNDEACDDMEASAKNNDLSEKSFSQEKKENVKEERQVIMKINKLEDITDENLKQCTASVITEFLSAELKKASDVYVAEKQQQATANVKLQESADKMATQISEMKASLETLTKERADRAKVDAFNSRMGEMVAAYELPEEVSKIVVDDLKAIVSDEAFASYKTKAETIFKPYSKVALAAVAKAKADAEAKAAEEAKAKQAKAEDDEAMAAKAPPFQKKDGKDDDDKDDKKDDKKKSAKASEEAVASVVEDAVDNAEKKDAGIPNTSSASAPGLKERFATAFAEENFVIKA